MPLQSSCHARPTLVVGVVVAYAACTVPEPPRAEWVTIPAGPIEVVAESLATYGIVKSASRFARFAQIGRRHLGIEAGTYPLRPGMPMGELLVTLRRGGHPLAQRFVVPPGIWLTELAVFAERELGIPAESVHLAARDTSLLERLGARGASAEGYLYPTEYRVPEGASARVLVQQMADTFLARWQPKWDARLDTLDLTRDEIVTLASIVEGEDPHETDRALIGSVYHNRLARNRRLEADPTVVYALGERRRLYNRDYGVPSEYNTYRVNGIPPAPIGQPSSASLRVVLYPAASNLFYFVARPDGRHIFAPSYREHLANIRAVRRPGASSSVAR
jgi:UPF0755 protein